MTARSKKTHWWPMAKARGMRTPDREDPGWIPKGLKSPWMKNRISGAARPRGPTMKLLKELRARVRRRHERPRPSETSGNRGPKTIEHGRRPDRQSPRGRSAQEKNPLGLTCIEHESFHTREERRGSRSRTPRRSMIIWMRMCGYRRRRFGPRRKKGKAS